MQQEFILSLMHYITMYVYVYINTMLVKQVSIWIIRQVLDNPYSPYAPQYALKC